MGSRLPYLKEKKHLFFLPENETRETSKQTNKQTKNRREDKEYMATRKLYNITSFYFYATWIVLILSSPICLHSINY